MVKHAYDWTAGQGLVVLELALFSRSREVLFGNEHAGSSSSDNRSQCGHWSKERLLMNVFIKKKSATLHDIFNFCLPILSTWSTWENSVRFFVLSMHLLSMIMMSLMDFSSMAVAFGEAEDGEEAFGTACMWLIEPRRCGFIGQSNTKELTC